MLKAENDFSHVYRKNMAAQMKYVCNIELEKVNNFCVNLVVREDSITSMPLRCWAGCKFPLYSRSMSKMYWRETIFTSQKFSSSAFFKRATNDFIVYRPYKENNKSEANQMQNMVLGC